MLYSQVGRLLSWGIPLYPKVSLSLFRVSIGFKVRLGFRVSVRVRRNSF